MSSETEGQTMVRRKAGDTREYGQVVELAGGRARVLWLGRSLPDGSRREYPKKDRTMQAMSFIQKRTWVKISNLTETE